VGEVVALLTHAGGNLVAILIKGGLVMVPLLASSVLSLAVIIERFLFWRRVRKSEGGETILSLVAAGHLAQAIKTARVSQHPVARVLLAGLEHQYPAPSMAMAATAQAEVHRLKRSLPMLDTIITLAPLLGLLGTITGMINSFGIVSEAGLGQPHAITGGVAEALIATATGLSVAILTLVPYNYFRLKAEAVTGLIEEHATRLELLLKACQVQEEK
jgi:biopolymer transport protein ExbB